MKFHTKKEQARVGIELSIMQKILEWKIFFKKYFLYVANNSLEKFPLEKMVFSSETNFFLPKTCIFGVVNTFSKINAILKKLN